MGQGDVQQGPNGIDAAGDGDAGRRGERDSLFKLATIRIPESGETVTVRVRNVSAGGLMAQASEALRPGMRVEVELDGVGRVAGAVAWSEAGRIGISFDHPVDKRRARASRDAPAQPIDLLRPVVDGRRPPLKTR